MLFLLYFLFMANVAWQHCTQRCGVTVHFKIKLFAIAIVTNKPQAPPAGGGGSIYKRNVKENCFFSSNSTCKKYKGNSCSPPFISQCCSGSVADVHKFTGCFEPPPNFAPSFHFPRVFSSYFHASAPTHHNHLPLLPPPPPPSL